MEYPINENVAKPRVSTGFLVVISVIAGVVGGWITILSSSSFGELAWKAALGLIIFSLLMRMLRGKQENAPLRHKIIPFIFFCMAFLAIASFIFAALNSIM